MLKNKSGVLVSCHPRAGGKRQEDLLSARLVSQGAPVSVRVPVSKTQGRNIIKEYICHQHLTSILTCTHGPHICACAHKHTHIRDRKREKARHGGRG